MARFAQIAVLSTIYIMNITSPEKPVQETCSLENIKPVKFEKMTLFKGTWKLQKCKPESYCKTITCAEERYEQNDGKGLLLHSSSYNVTSGKASMADGKVKVTGLGKYEVEADDPKLRGEYHVLGTDYKHYLIEQACIQGISYIFVKCRGDALKDSAKAVIANLLKRNGEDLRHLTPISPPPKNKGCKSLLPKVDQKRNFQKDQKSETKKDKKPELKQWQKQEAKEEQKPEGAKTPQFNKGQKQITKDKPKPTASRTIISLFTASRTTTPPASGFTTSKSPTTSTTTIIKSPTTNTTTTKSPTTSTTTIIKSPTTSTTTIKSPTTSTTTNKSPTTSTTTIKSPTTSTTTTKSRTTTTSTTNTATTTYPTTPSPTSETTPSSESEELSLLL